MEQTYNEINPSSLTFVFMGSINDLVAYSFSPFFGTTTSGIFRNFPGCGTHLPMGKGVASRGNSDRSNAGFKAGFGAFWGEDSTVLVNFFLSLVSIGISSFYL
ncbi:MAG TPA: hypothetical protein P5154_08370, partial [Candidatus Izemoplasmatales bacterium]|nr:hypothetical protein [Candidatus Izemoplasmatales bacterium]